MTQVVRRSTKYTNDVLNIVRSKQHATNAEIAHELRKVHAEVSDTTVHRVTQRLYDDGLIGLAPPTKKGCLRYDGYTKLHDHSCVVIVVICEISRSLMRYGVKLRVN